MPPVHSMRQIIPLARCTRMSRRRHLPRAPLWSGRCGGSRPCCSSSRGNNSRDGRGKPLSTTRSSSQGRGSKFLSITRSSHSSSLRGRAVNCLARSRGICIRSFSRNRVAHCRGRARSRSRGKVPCTVSACSSKCRHCYPRGAGGEHHHHNHLPCTGTSRRPLRPLPWGGTSRAVHCRLPRSSTAPCCGRAASTLRPCQRQRGRWEKAEVTAVALVQSRLPQRMCSGATC